MRSEFESPRGTRAAGPRAKRARRLLSGTAAWGLMAATAAAQGGPTIPTADTEDAELGSRPVGSGRVHPFVSFDVRNGDYARGAYDDDASDLRRLPVHAQLGLAVDLHSNAKGSADAFFLMESNNGFHSPNASETSPPRAWYESNNLFGFAFRPVEGLTTALTYTNKRSPNGVSGISHEISLAAAYEDERSALGKLHPNIALTGRPADGRGSYVRVGVEPEWKLGRSEQAARVSTPLHVGVGVGGFYQAGTGTVSYGDFGVALTQPFRVAGRRLSLRGEILALVRDPTLRRLDGDDANHAAVVPLATVGVSAAF